MTFSKCIMTISLRWNISKRFICTSSNLASLSILTESDLTTEWMVTLVDCHILGFPKANFHNILQCWFSAVFSDSGRHPGWFIERTVPTLTGNSHRMKAKCETYSRTESTNYRPWAECSPPHFLVNNILLNPGASYSFIDCLWPLIITMADLCSCYRDCVAHKT